MLFGAEGVVTAARSRHVQAGCRAASLLHRDYTAEGNLCGAVRTVCQSSTPQQHPPASVSEPQVHSGSKDAKQLEFIAVSSDHKTLHQLTDCSSTWTGLFSCQSDEHLSVVCFTFTLFTFCFVFILA